MEIRFGASGYIETEFRHFPASPECHEFAIFEIRSDQGKIQFYSQPTWALGAGFTIAQLRAIHEVFSKNITRAKPIDDEIPF